MDTWTKWTEFLACGILALPATLGIGYDSFEVFAVSLGLMQILFITVAMGAPTVAVRAERKDKNDRRQD